MWPPRRSVTPAWCDCDSLSERGGHVDLDSITAEAGDLVKRDPAQAARVSGNLIVYGLGTWLAEGRWLAAERDRPAPGDFAEVCLGLDGSDSDDWTALRAETIDGWQFTPTYGPDNRPCIWIRPSGTAASPAARSTPRSTSCRPATGCAGSTSTRMTGWSEGGGWSVRYGNVYEFRTDRLDRAHTALGRFDVDLGTGALTHDACPTTATHVANARRVAKAGQKYLLGKPAQRQKIDAAMASVICHEAAADARADGWDGVPADTRVVIFR